MVTKIVCRKLSDFKETEIKDNTQEEKQRVVWYKDYCFVGVEYNKFRQQTRTIQGGRDFG